MNKIKEEDHPVKKGTWKELYSELARNEINSVMAANSNFFKEFIGESFHYASQMAHKLYNVCLIGASASNYVSVNKRDRLFNRQQSISELAFVTSAFNHPDNSIVLNPGPSYTINSDDILYYISIHKDENFIIQETKNALFIPRNSIMVPMHHRNNVADRISSHESVAKHDVFVESDDFETQGYSLATPKTQLYIGCYRPTCICLKNPLDICCLELNAECAHKKLKQASDYHWKEKCIIVAALTARISLFNFITILRSANNLNATIRPIVLLLENSPSVEFLESIRVFPLVYWIKGNISNISILRKAGIERCETMVIVSIDKNKPLDDDYISDTSNIFAVHNIRRLFKNTKIISELTNPSNVRFFEQTYFAFNNHETAADDDDTSNLMYSAPFAAGDIFFASMIDTMLYQAYYKPYLIEFVRLMIGMDQFDNSGFLRKVKLSEDYLSSVATYGQLYEKLICDSGEVPIGIYRTEANVDNRRDPIEVSRLLSAKSGERVSSYVLINPYDDIELQLNDVIYTIRAQ